MPDLHAIVIDPQIIRNLRGLNPDDNGEFLREIISIYLEDTPLRIADLDQSLAAGDVQRFARAAHSVKGSSANLGASILRATCERLEQEARQNGLKAVGPLVVQVKLEFDVAAGELRKLLVQPA